MVCKSDRPRQLKAFDWQLWKGDWSQSTSEEVTRVRITRPKNTFSFFFFFLVCLLFVAICCTYVALLWAITKFRPYLMAFLWCESFLPMEISLSRCCQNLFLFHLIFVLIFHYERLNKVLCSGGDGGKMTQPASFSLESILSNNAGHWKHRFWTTAAPLTRTSLEWSIWCFS